MKPEFSDSNCWLGILFYITSSERPAQFNSQCWGQPCAHRPFLAAVDLTNEFLGQLASLVSNRTQKDHAQSPLLMCLTGWEEQMREHMRRTGAPPHPYFGFPPDLDRERDHGRDFDKRLVSVPNPADIIFSTFHKVFGMLVTTVLLLFREASDGQFDEDQAQDGGQDKREPASPESLRDAPRELFPQQRRSPVIQKDPFDDGPGDQRRHDDRKRERDRDEKPRSGRENRGGRGDRQRDREDRHDRMDRDREDRRRDRDGKDRPREKDRSRDDHPREDKVRSEKTDQDSADLLRPSSRERHGSGRDRKNTPPESHWSSLEFPGYGKFDQGQGKRKYA